MHILLEYSSNYSDTTVSFWFYSKDEATNFDANIEDDDAIKSLKYQPKLLGNTEADGTNKTLRNTTTAATLRYLSNFSRSL